MALVAVCVWLIVWLVVFGKVLPDDIVGFAAVVFQVTVKTGVFALLFARYVAGAGTVVAPADPEGKVGAAPGLRAWAHEAFELDAASARAMSSQAETRGAVQFHAASSSSRQAASTASGKAHRRSRASEDANASDALSASDASSDSAAAIKRIANRVSDSSKAEKHCRRFVSRASAVRARKATARRGGCCS